MSRIKEIKEIAVDLRSMKEHEEFSIDDPRIKEIEVDLRKWINFDAAIHLLAVHMLSRKLDELVKFDYIHMLEQSVKIIGIQIEEQTIATKIAISENQIATRAIQKNVEIKHNSSMRGKAAADALHSKPGNSRDKQEAIRTAWASGKYSSRDLCAEQECAALNMAPGTARRALRNTPEPPRRCTA